MDAIRKRKSKCRSWYLDLMMIAGYWGSERVYHHTAPITMIYALYEALRVVMEEGLDARWGRHRLNAAALHAGPRWAATAIGHGSNTPYTNGLGSAFGVPAIEPRRHDTDSGRSTARVPYGNAQLAQRAGR